MPARAASPVTISYKPGAMSRGQRGDETLALHHDVLEVLGAGNRRQQEAEIQLAGGERRRLLRRQHFAQC